MESGAAHHEDLCAALDTRAAELAPVEQIDLVHDGVNGIARLKAEARAGDGAVRWCAASRLGEVNPAFHARDTELLELALADPDRAVRQEAIAVLALLCPDLPTRIVERVVDRVLCDDVSVVHQDGRVLLGVHAVARDADAVAEELIKVLGDPDPVRRSGIELRLRALAHFDAERAAPVIGRGLQDPERDVRLAVASALPLAPWSIVEPFAALALEDPDLRVRRCAFVALLQDRIAHTPRHTVASVRSALETGDDTSRMIATWSLPVIAAHAPVETAGMYDRAFGDGDARVVTAAMSGLRELVRRRPSDAKPLIRAALADEVAFRFRTLDVTLGLTADLHPFLAPALLALCGARPSQRLDILEESKARLAWALETCRHVRAAAERLHATVSAPAAV